MSALEKRLARVEDTCKWLESGTSILTTDMASDIRSAIAELQREWYEAEGQLTAVRACLGAPDGMVLDLKNVSGRLKEIENLGYECGVGHQERDLAAEHRVRAEQQRDDALDAATDAFNDLQTFMSTGNEGFVCDAMRTLDAATKPEERKEAPDGQH